MIVINRRLLSRNYCIYYADLSMKLFKQLN